MSAQPRPRLVTPDESGDPRGETPTRGAVMRDRYGRTRAGWSLRRRRGDRLPEWLRLPRPAGPGARAVWTDRRVPTGRLVLAVFVGLALLGWVSWRLALAWLAVCALWLFVGLRRRRTHQLATDLYRWTEEITNAEGEEAQRIQNRRAVIRWIQHPIRTLIYGPPVQEDYLVRSRTRPGKWVRLTVARGVFQPDVEHVTEVRIRLTQRFEERYRDEIGRLQMQVEDWWLTDTDVVIERGWLHRWALFTPRGPVGERRRSSSRSRPVEGWEET